MEAHADAVLAPCRNCGAVPVAQMPPPRFCAQCGQERTLHPPTLVEFLHEFAGHYVALEGPLWRTLGLLVARPGRLTREYLAGRRRRYVLPLRLYLTASFLFFVVLKLIPSAVDEVAASEDGHPPAVTAAGTAHAPQAAAPPASAGWLAHRGASAPTLRISDCDTPGHPACNSLERWVMRSLDRANRDPATFVEHLRAHALAIAPYAVFLLLPVFAGIVMLAWRDRGMTYGEHFVFSLHLHAFWFLALLLVALLPRDGSDLVQLAIPVYGVMALREVYGGGWLATVARAVAASVLYGAALLAAMAGLLALLLATT